MKPLLLLLPFLLGACAAQRHALPLYIAAQQGNAEVVRNILATGTDADATPANTYGRPLHQAVLNGHRDIVEILLAAGADVNAEAENELTPLWLAARYNRADIIPLLMKAGANTKHACTYYNFTPLMVAAYYQNEKAIQALLDNGDNAATRTIDLNGMHTERNAICATLLHDSCPPRAAKRRIVSKLIEAGADVQFPEKNNMNYIYMREQPLCMAMEAEDPELVRLMIKHGALKGHEAFYRNIAIDRYIHTPEQREIKNIILQATEK